MATWISTCTYYIILQSPLVFFLVRFTGAPRQVCSRIAVTAEKRLGTSAAAFLGTAPPIVFALVRFIGLDSAGSLLTPQLTLSQSVCKIFNGGSSLSGKIAFSLGLWAPSQSAEAEKWPVGNFPIYSNTEFLDLLSA